MDSFKIVVGNGWAALGLVSFLIQARSSLLWLVGTGAEILSPLVSFEPQESLPLLKKLDQQWELNLGEPQEGAFLCSYSQHTFQDLASVPIPHLEEENCFAPFSGLRFSRSLSEVEDEWRKKVLKKVALLGIKRIENDPLVQVHFENQSLRAIQLGSGQTFHAQHLFYADRWDMLSTIQSMPKKLNFFKQKKGFGGVLQACFEHQPQMLKDSREGFFIPLLKESKAEKQRYFLGHFFSEGKKSIWTLPLTLEEEESQHEILKKIRRLKLTLNRVHWEKKGALNHSCVFKETIINEKIVFQNRFYYAQDRLFLQAQSELFNSGISLFTDSFGLGAALIQVGKNLNIV